MHIRFSVDNDPGTAPAGWARITIRLGDHVETAAAQIGEWGERDYLEHWDDARLACLRGDQFVVFCTSRPASADEMTDLWIGRRTERGYRFFNCAASRDEVQFSGKAASLSDYTDFGPEQDAGVSVWNVALSDIAEWKA
jgi:hypothetical protein